MSKEKQIEELTDVITSTDDNGYAYDSEGFEITGYANSSKIAEALYNAGYRKQSEGEWRSELVKRCDWKGKKQQYYQPNSCSLCHEPVLKRTPFCPNFGAKMKGGAQE